MEKAKQVCGVTTSSFASELFGPKDLTKSSSSSLTHFGALFGQSSMEHGKDLAYNGITRSIQNHSTGNSFTIGKHESFNKGERNGSMGKDPNPYSQNGSVDPCYYSSSIYYGGQEVYYSTAIKNHNNYQHRKYGENDDDDDDDDATRGNWWQGSLYY